MFNLQTPAAGDWDSSLAISVTDEGMKGTLRLRLRVSYEALIDSSAPHSTRDFSIKIMLKCLSIEVPRSQKIKPQRYDLGDPVTSFDLQTLSKEGFRPLPLSCDD